MGRKRTRNYRELRVDDEEFVDDEEELEDEDEEDEDEEDEEDSGDDEDEDEEEKPKKKKKKAKAPAKPRAKRTRAAKVTRMKVVWKVFDNSHKPVATYEYKQRKEAEEHAAKLTAAKPNNTHFIQPVKEPMEVSG